MNESDTGQWQSQALHQSGQQEIYHTPGFNDPNIHFRITYILLIPVTLLIFLFNIPVLISVALNKKLHIPTFYFVTSLGIADILVGITCLGKIAVPDEKTYGLCLVRFFFLIMPTSASIFSIFWIAVDRYIAIESPLLYQQKMTAQKAIAVISGTWIYATIVGLFVLWWNLGQEDERCSFLYVVHPGYVWFLFVASMVIPTTANIVIYGRIFLVTRKHIRKINAIEGTVFKNERLANSACEVPNDVFHFKNNPSCTEVVGSQTTANGRLFTCTRTLLKTNELQLEMDMSNETENDRIHKGTNHKQDSSSKQISNNTVFECNSLFLYSVTSGEDEIVGATCNSQSQPSVNSIQVALANQGLQGNNRDRRSNKAPINKDSQKSAITRNSSINKQSKSNRELINTYHYSNTSGKRDSQVNLLIPDSLTYQPTLLRPDVTSQDKVTRTQHLPANHIRPNIYSSPSFVRTLRAVKKLSVILGCFLLTWGPFALVCVTQVLCGYEKCELRDVAGSYLLLLGFCNSFLNPLVYALWNKHFRDITITRLQSLCPYVNQCCCCHRNETPVMIVQRQASLVPISTIGKT